MTRVVDTSAWIEWLLGFDAGKAVKAKLPKEEDWLVPTIVQFELAKWAKRKLGHEDSQQVIAHSDTCVIVDLDSTIALVAADLSSVHKLAMADAIVYATALEHDADVLTCDAHFAQLERVIYVPNRR